MWNQIMLSFFIFQEITDQFGAITEVPEMFENLVSQSVQLIKEALLTTDKR